MCGRFANHLEALDDWESLLTDWPADGITGFNICPTQIIPAFTASGGQPMRWGLIPGWSNTLASKYSTFNARVETLESKPAFRNAWSTGQRCLIPALGYYEWRAANDGKQPYFVRSSTNGPLVFAGLYEPVGENSVPASCTIITQPAILEMTRLHPRMPVMLNLQQAEKWLDGPAEQARAIAVSEEIPGLRIYRVSKAVNNVHNQGPLLIEREPEKTEQ